MEQVEVRALVETPEQPCPRTLKLWHYANTVELTCQFNAYHAGSHRHNFPGVFVDWMTESEDES